VKLDRKIPQEGGSKSNLMATNGDHAAGVSPLGIAVQRCRSRLSAPFAGQDNPELVIGREAPELLPGDRLNLNAQLERVFANLLKKLELLLLRGLGPGLYELVEAVRLLDHAGGDRRGVHR